MAKNGYILHIIRQEKFTSGIISFMQNKMTNYQHKFIVKDVKNSKFILSGFDEKDVYHIGSYLDLILDSRIKKLLKNSSKIIVEGIYGVDIPMYFWCRSLMEKTYMQFWGGDYYSLIEKTKRNKNLKQRTLAAITRRTMVSCIKRCKAVVMLIDNEYKDFIKATGIEKPHFVAPVCSDGSALLMMEKVENNPKQKEPHLVLVGNSASESNYHKEALDMLVRFKNEDIKVICPLSYGPQDYANDIISYGKKLFGEKFEALTEFMDKEKYFEFLAKISVGIFLNDRQEALGNINAILRFGGKLYLRKGTSVWDKYKNSNYRFCSVEEILRMNFEEFINISTEDAKINNILRKSEGGIDKNINAWEKVLSD